MILGFVLIILKTLAVASICITYHNNATVFAFSSNVSDHQVLISVKNSITGDPLGVLSSWNHSIHFCLSEGVTCSRRHQRVTKLDLSSQKLEGILSPHISNLTFLMAIYLNTNCFHGSIPNEIGHLFCLRYLYLSDNFFHGGFPANLTCCLDIRNISLSHNNLGGKMPTQFAFWSKLNSFSLKSNYFTGSISPSIGNLSSLRRFDVSENNLKGSIPLEVGHLFKIKFLALQLNNLSGTVPLQLYNISSIAVIGLVGNQLEESLPPDLGFTLPNLQEFYAGGNKFSGIIPPSIGNASNLAIFDIPHNNIVGPLKLDFGIVPNLEWLNVGRNQLGHNQPSGDLSFLNSLVNCTHLINFNLNANGLRGELPNSIVNFSTTIQKLSLSGNYLYGSISQDIGQLVNLQTLSLSDNNLTRNVPESIGQLSKLGKLYLNGNQFSGEIPASISNVTGLLTLALDNNMLQGSIPTALFNISTVQLLTLSYNRLSGVIPDEIIGLSSQCHNLRLSNNLFTGPLPSNIGSLKQLVELDVSQNNLTGEIPTTLGECVMLKVLWMEGNLFRDYGMGGEVSAEGDVYSYGILLLELFSGKRPTDGSILIENATTLHEYVRKALPDRVMQIADPRIILLDHYSTTANESHMTATTIHVCLATIFEVGILCSAETPKERIDISDALKQLHVARDLLVSPGQ